MGGGRGMRAGGVCAGNTAPQLVERLRARLGEEAVYGLCSIAEHRPEAAWQRVHALPLDCTLRARAPLARRDIPEQDMPRPVWLLDAPVILEAPQVQPLRQSDLVLEQGPERIESGWWDGNDVARDYYIARQAGGARLWVFQERRSQCWYLHGVFA
jgi:protein ImuB